MWCGMQPTAEQRDARDLFTAGLNLAIQAGAGTGKTSTLKLLGASTAGRGQYLAFNRSIVEDASRSMPRNVNAKTVHALAWRFVGKQYGHRLESGRERSSELARRLRVDPLLVHYGSRAKMLQPGFLASLTMRSVLQFCQSADEQPGPQHVPYVAGIDLPTGKGEPTCDNNLAVREHIAPAMIRAWEDLSDPTGTLPFKHDHYLKAWERRDPQIGADFVMLDEAQDASPVMVSIIAQQRDCQVVAVGDTQQSIYGWRGAVDALQTLPSDAITFLTRSFRFGQPIADVANLVLARLRAELRLSGNPALVSTVEPTVTPDAILCRTNAMSLSTMMEHQRQGRRVHLIGGGTEVASFARGAQDLMETGGTWHPDLACFDSWQEVVDYVGQDPQGDELALWVELIEEYGVATILDALQQMPEESAAHVVVSTAHKAKGRQWPSVQLANDFMEPDDVLGDGDEEWRLLYVALTRAQVLLDVEACAPIQTLIRGGKRSVGRMGDGLLQL